MHAVLNILFSVPAFVVLACVVSLAFEWKGDRRNMMGSIEKLREWSRLFDDMYVMEEGDICHIYNSPLTDSMKSWGEMIREQCGEIEREIAERYMPLPVDADGVPIRVGDTLECHANGYDGVFDTFAVGDDCVIGNHPECEVFNDPFKGIHVARYCRHVATRTIEDVLKAFFHDALDADAFCTVRLDDVLAKYAAEIRELMGEDR